MRTQKTQPNQALRPPQWLVWLALCVFTSALLIGQVAHYVSTPHQLCHEHAHASHGNEQEHHQETPDTFHADASEGQSLSSDHASAHDCEHCDVVGSQRDATLVALHKSPTPPALALRHDGLCSLTKGIHHARLHLYLLAPKNSPPNSFGA